VRIRNYDFKTVPQPFDLGDRPSSIIRQTNAGTVGRPLHRWPEWQGDQPRSQKEKSQTRNPMPSAPIRVQADWTEVRDLNPPIGIEKDIARLHRLRKRPSVAYNGAISGSIRLAGHSLTSTNQLPTDEVLIF
jgi:hypothetical protein